MTDDALAIRTENLGYAYRGKGAADVLSGLSISVKKGECCAVLGPNGSGKSTLMRLLSGIETPKNGSVHLLGRPLSQWPKKERASEIAFVPQNVSVSFSMKVREFVMAGRAPLQGVLGFERTADRTAVDEAMVFTDVSRFAGRDITELSGGERQRVSLAAAIAQEPSVLLLDEPTSALDPAHQIRVMDLLHRLKRERNVTVVMVLHHINLAAMYADSVVLLKNGRLAARCPVCALNSNLLESVYDCRFVEDNHPLFPVPRFSPVPGSPFFPRP